MVDGASFVIRARGEKVVDGLRAHSMVNVMQKPDAKATGGREKNCSVYGLCVSVVRDESRGNTELTSRCRGDRDRGEEASLLAQ